MNYTCMVCGDTFEWKHRGGPQKLTCSDACRKVRRAKKFREYRAENSDRYRDHSRRWREENKERVREYNRDYYSKNYDYFSAKSKAWKSSNPDEVAEYNKSYYEKNSEYFKEYRRQWAAANPEKIRASQQRRRTRIEGAFVEDVLINVLIERGEGNCGICGKEFLPGTEYGDPLYPTVDHVIPISKGGQHSYENTQAAHFSCNSRKSSKLDGWQGLTPFVGDEETR